MSNDLDLYSGGDLQPFSPGGDLQPYSPAADGWGVEPDYIAERPAHALGQLEPQIEQNIAAIATVFEHDMASLGFVQADIQKCINWFKQSLASPVQRMPQIRHKYQTWQFSHDPAFQAFCNYAATQRFPQELIQSVAFWLQQLEDFQHGAGRFAGQQVQSPAYSTDPTDQLTDSQYEAVLAANNQAAANTLGYLRDLWGSSYEANLALVKKTFAALPVAEQEHLSQFSTGWIKATNTPEILLGLYRQAIGSGTLPKSGAEISREIASIENVMRTERAKYLKDDQLQARYRELLRARGY